MFLFHAKDLKQSKFFFPAFCQKTVAVDQKDHSKKSDDIYAKLHYYLNRGFPHHFFKAFTQRQRTHNIKHYNRTDTRQPIRKNILSVLTEICFCKFCIQQTIHDAHHLSQ